MRPFVIRNIGAAVILSVALSVAGASVASGVGAGGIPSGARPAVRDTSAAAEIAAVLAALDSAASARDVDRFFGYFVDGPSFAYVFDGRVMRSLDEVRAMHRRSWASLREARFHTATPRVAVVAPGVATAVAAGHSERVRADGTAQSGDYAVMLLLVKDGGRWRVLQAHESTTRH
ncbi:MAG TPA: SgcJ/EcaC family oxidoreductase [Gemmatimonadaceae bacterium]